MDYTSIFCCNLVLSEIWRTMNLFWKSGVKINALNYCKYYSFSWSVIDVLFSLTTSWSIALTYNVILNLEPFPSSVSTSTDPPILLIISLLMFKSIPVPLWLIFVCSISLFSFLNNFLTFSLLMPIPLSSTIIYIFIHFSC